jgi:hypothetical protein
MKINIFGPFHECEDMRAALSILVDAPGVMVKQPLASASNPLAGRDYHVIACTELAVYPHVRMAPGLPQ